MSAKWRAAHPERVREGDAKYRAAHPERVRAWKAKYRAANPEQARARARADYYKRIEKQLKEKVYVATLRIKACLQSSNGGGNGGTDPGRGHGDGSDRA